MRLNNAFCRVVLSTVLGLSFLAGASSFAHADRDDRCRRDVHKAEERLAKEVRKHGEHSRQAEQRRRELEQVRARCH